MTHMYDIVTIKPITLYTNLKNLISTAVLHIIYNNHCFFKNVPCCSSARAYLVFSLWCL